MRKAWWWLVLPVLMILESCGGQSRIVLRAGVAAPRCAYSSQRFCTNPLAGGRGPVGVWRLVRTGEAPPRRGAPAGVSVYEDAESSIVVDGCSVLMGTGSYMWAP